MSLCKQFLAVKCPSFLLCVLNYINFQDSYGYLPETEQDEPIIQFLVPTPNLLLMSKAMMHACTERV